MPPMQASTWQGRPQRSASAAISATGSITPCGYCGAEATRSTVLGETASAMAAGSARQSARTGTRTERTPK